MHKMWQWFWPFRVLKRRRVEITIETSETWDLHWSSETRCNTCRSSYESDDVVVTHKAEEAHGLRSSIREVQAQIDQEQGMPTAPEDIVTSL